ncbi:MAG: hypothetical protein DRP66_11640 [Planctomycetota bacterium]|nr:MAG: hypothetical protein DRP66_11640 [Planctomycetota bacterium]
MLVVGRGDLHGRTWSSIAATKENVATNFHQLTRIILDFNGREKAQKAQKKQKLLILGLRLNFLYFKQL